MLLRGAGCKVKEQHLIRLLRTRKEYYPAFPDKGTLDIEVREDAGGKLRSLKDSGVSIGAQNLITCGLVRTGLLPICAKKPELVTEEDKESSSEEEVIHDVVEEPAMKFCLQLHQRTCLTAISPYSNPGSVPPCRMTLHQDSQKT